MEKSMAFCCECDGEVEISFLQTDYTRIVCDTCISGGYQQKTDDCDWVD